MRKSSPKARGLLLIIDSDRQTVDLVERICLQEGFDVRTARSVAEGREELRANPLVVVVNAQLVGGDAAALLAKSTHNFSLIVLAESTAIARSGDVACLDAVGCLVKPIQPLQLRIALSHVETDAADVLLDDAGLPSAANIRDARLVRVSQSTLALYDQIQQVAPTQATTLLTGESGTGKELVAETIHALSPRAKGVFVALNCGAISPSLIESELFGHEKGSFTGATRQHAGYFERARGGTLFLDEITEMPLDLQVRLLRVLETRTIMRVGGDRPVTIDVRIIAATNRNPQEAVQSGKLRVDLMYRLAVFSIHVPALRERLKDIEPLARQFLSELNWQTGIARTFSPAAFEHLRGQPWPGNARELWNVVQRACVLSKSATVSVSDLGALTTDRLLSPTAGEFTVKVGDKLDAVEEHLIRATLAHSETREQAARTLGISVKTLYNRLRVYQSRSNAIGSAPIFTSGRVGQMQEQLRQ